MAKQKQKPLDRPTLSPADAARYLDLSPRTLEKFRHEGRGPAFVAISCRCIRYRLADVEAWLLSQRTVQTVRASA